MRWEIEGTKQHTGGGDACGWAWGSGGVWRRL